MEKITTDISSFENLRKGGYVYVDKTDLINFRTAKRNIDEPVFVNFTVKKGLT